MVNIDGTKISSATIDGTNVKEITVDGDLVWNAVPESGVLRWSFDNSDTDSNTINDSWNSRNGSINGATTGVTGKINEAYSFDGSNDYVEDADAENYLEGLSAISVSLWVKSNETGTNKGFVKGKDPDGNDGVLAMRYDSEGATTTRSDCIKVGISTTTDGAINIESSANVQTTNWQHIVLTWASGNSLKIYIDGSQDTGAETESASGDLTGFTKLLVGKSAKDETSAWNGKIDDLRIYDKELSSSEVSNLYNNGSIGGQTGQTGGIVDDFERASLDHYAGQTGSFEISTTRSYTGDNSLFCNDELGGFSIRSTSGLENYPSAGDTFAWNFYENSNNKSNTKFGLQDGSNYYEVNHIEDENTLSLIKTEGGSGNTLVSTNVSIGQNQWYEVEVDWGSGGNITVKIFSTSGGSRDTELASINTTDSTFTSGGIGFFSTDRDTSNADTYWDNFRIL